MTVSAPIEASVEGLTVDDLALRVLGKKFGHLGTSVAEEDFEFEIRLLDDEDAVVWQNAFTVDTPDFAMELEGPVF